MDNRAVGTKAANLGLIHKMGLNIPPAICLRSDLLNINKQATSEFLNYLKEEIQTLVPSDPGWAIRSSSIEEDGFNKSMAGQFVSVIIMDAYELPEAVCKVIQSATIKGGEENTMGVIIQQFIEPDFGGVVFGIMYRNMDMRYQIPHRFIFLF